MADNPNMKMKYFFQKTLQVLYSNGRADGRANGQAEKKLHVPMQESSVGVQTQLIEKSSYNLELGILQFYSGGPMFYLKKNYCSPRFHRLPRG